VPAARLVSMKPIDRVARFSVGACLTARAGIAKHGAAARERDAYLLPLKRHSLAAWRATPLSDRK